MTRFEIQEIACQNQDGITFLALDKATQEPVALRRFFPFGQNYLGDEDELNIEGLEPQETKAFSIACERLSTINHPALRKTLFGSADPVDGMPYLVTEWIDGESLSSILGNNVMEPAAVIDLIRLALEVCQVLSSTLESEAVWIDTKKDAIIVCDANVNPTFSFRICPFKWLGTQTHHKDLTGIVQLVEELIGWNSRIVSDQAGLGLGGWLKLVRQNPVMSLQEAIDTLPNPYTQAAQAQISGQNRIERPAQPLILASANPSLLNGKSISIIALLACLAIGLIFFLHQWNNQRIKQIKRTEANSVAADLTGLTDDSEPTQNDTIEAKSLRMREEIARIEEQKNLELAAIQKIIAERKQAAAIAASGDIVTLSPDDMEALEKLETSTPVRVKGLVKFVQIPETGKLLYFFFSNPYDGKQIRALAYPSNFDGKHTDEEFKKIEKELQNLVGKNVIFEGVTNKFANMENPRLVRVISRKNIIVEK